VSDPSVFGFLNIHKPLGVTSHDIVMQVRRTFGLRKVGHAGTLDPLATGVLIICVGGATRLSEYVMHMTKGYIARVKLGETTATYDAEGEITSTRPAAHITRAQVEAALAPFRGSFEQKPPIYSAIKVNGRKLYDIARAGQSVELKARPVEIHRLVLTEWQPPYFSIDVSCTAGTYIRSLAYDIGEALGCGAHLTALERTQSGSFLLTDAITPDDLVADPQWQRHLISAETALVGWRHVMLTHDQAQHMGHGGALPHDGADEGETALAYTSAQQLLAVVRAESGMWVPQKVFIQAVTE
jgi:tRNA pseudouridine55 synthase